MSETILSSRVRLARNYADLPFAGRITPAQSEQCVQRTLDALRDLPEVYTFLPLRGMEDTERKALVESHLISPDLLKNEENAAVLIRGDEKISVMMNEEDHLRLQAFCAGENLAEAAENVFAIEDALQLSAVCPQIQKRRDHHIAADPCPALEIQNSITIFHSLLLRRQGG